MAKLLPAVRSRRPTAKPETIILPLKLPAHLHRLLKDLARTRGDSVQDYVLNTIVLMINCDLQDNLGISMRYGFGEHKGDEGLVWEFVDYGKIGGVANTAALASPA